jgi:hypothetical protein
MAKDIKRMAEGRVRDGRTYVLGLDFGTQAVKVVVLDVHSAEVLHTNTFDYDNAFAHYSTRGGVLPTEQLEIRHTSPFMLIEALDFAFRRLHEDDVDMSCIKAIKSDAMQHCTVYTDASFGERAAALDDHQCLLPQLRSSITRQTSPIWKIGLRYRKRHISRVNLRNTALYKPSPETEQSYDFPQLRF